MLISNNEKKRLNSTKKYIDMLTEEHSKLNVIRVDLSYHGDNGKNITAEEANKDMNRLFSNMRSKPSIFIDKVGYVMKREYTEDKGMHFHAVFFFNGQKVLKDAHKADEIGAYWSKNITKERGVYHNCNNSKYKNHGIGMLEHRDSEKRKILDTKVIAYLTKEEQTIAPIKENKHTKSFTRGTIPRKKTKLGRPRIEK
ncbi:inovirus-type Gp2 protein [Sulfurimonas sp. SAG-AH-194-I05]|nr:inovirus-type Gp2 protein [Sulfurimonas sp. SAG-AH-194-I05]MDF1875202.1 inovirus-type Gp2 protein [Sulfurimonas sp. SAG-AH-194-I05]